VSAAAELLIFLAIIYTIECFRWVAQTAVIANITPFGSSVAAPWRLATQFQRALAFGFPLPPFGSLYDCEGLPFEASEAGLRFPPLTVGSRPTKAETLVPWGELGPIHLHDLVLRRGSSDLHRFGSRAAAAAATDALTALRGASTPKARERVMSAQLASQFDEAALQARLRPWQRWRWPVRLANSALFTAIFVGLGSMALATRPPSPVLIVVLVVTSWLLALVVNVVAIRRVLPQPLRPQGLQWLSLTVSPLSLIRSFDVIEPELVGGFSSALVVAMTLPAARAEPFLQQMRRELEHPVTPASIEAASAEWLVGDEVFRRASLAQLDRLMQRHGLEPSVPRPLGLHCPRCLNTYSVARDTCSSCPGVALVGSPPLAAGQSVPGA
jgi:hypothetical protein